LPLLFLLINLPATPSPGPVHRDGVEMQQSIRRSEAADWTPDQKPAMPRTHLAHSRLAFQELRNKHQPADGGHAPQIVEVPSTIRRMGSFPA
jgi:hypothetical protein